VRFRRWLRRRAFAGLHFLARQAALFAASLRAWPHVICGALKIVYNLHIPI